MLGTKNGVGLLIVMFTAVAIGCASTGTPKTIAAGDLPSLAGTWDGTLIPPSGGMGSTPTTGTLTLSANGDYAARAGAFAAQGKAQVKDGGLQLTSTSTTGGLATGQRTSTAALSERPDGTLVLTGFGHSDAGPFNFEVTRRK